MKNIMLSIPNQNYYIFLEELEKLEQKINLGIKIQENVTEKENILIDLKDAIQEVKMIKKGAKKGVLAKDLLNELKNL